MNFIFVSLCDNDFQTLLEATKYVWENKEHDLTEGEFKHYVIAYVMFKQSVRRINKNFIGEKSTCLKEYFDKSLQVYYTDDKPEVDHDGGSVILDTNTGYAWRT